MKNYKVFIIIVTVLVVANSVLLGMFWFKQPGLLIPGTRQRPAANVYLSKELNLTNAQEKAYDTLKNNHAALTRQLNELSRKLKDSLFEHIKTPVLNTAAAGKLERKIATIQISLDSATLDHFRKFRAILDATQQVKFDRVIKNALHMMGGAPPQGRGRNHDGPPNGMPAGDGQGPPPPRDGQGPPPGEGPPPGN